MSEAATRPGPGRPPGTTESLNRPLSLRNRRRLLQDLNDRAHDGDAIAAAVLILLSERAADLRADPELEDDQ